MSAPVALQSLAPETYGYLRPRAIGQTTGSVDNADVLRTGKRDFNPPASQICTLMSTAESHATVLLDYGVVVSGIPVFFVQSVEPAEADSEVVLQASYSEVLAYVDRPDGDGPFPFTAGADTLRINKYRISQPGMIEHFQLQGGQRWQRLELLTPGTVRLTLVGFRPTTLNQDPRDMAGYFECSDAQLNDIWRTGARTVQVNSIPARTSVPNWQVLPTGTYISSQRVSHYVWGGSWDDYAVRVEACILEGGFAVAVRSRQGFGPLFQFYLDGTRLRVDLLYGFYNQSQVTLWPTQCATWEGDVSDLPGGGLSLGAWKRWEISAFGSDEYVVRLEGQVLTTFAQRQGEKTDANGGTKDVQPHEGTFGFGTGKDQTAMFRNATVVSGSGQLLYSSSLRDPHVLSDFAVGTNQLPGMLDGPKRDRAVWLGDNIVPALALYYSTGLTDYVSGSIETILARQRDDGTIPAYGLVGYPVIEVRSEDDVSQSYQLLAGSFTMYVIRVCHDYLLYTGDVDYVRSLYPRLQKLLALVAAKVDKRGLVRMEGLWAVDSDYYNKPRTGATTKHNALYAIALRCLAAIADALGDLDDAAAAYRLRAEQVGRAVNALLFDQKTGLYDASEDDRGIVSEDANAFAMLAGFPTSAAQRTAILRALKASNASPGGCLSFDAASGYMKTPVVSPIMNGWHAEAALQTGRLDDFGYALELWRACWGPMVDERTPFYSGCHWEFSTPGGTPHMEHFCSMAHPFSSLPVYSLSVHALGLSPIRPGWAEFDFSPHAGFLDTLEHSSGRVPTPTPHGGTIRASWKQESKGVWSATIAVPLGCVGRVSWPRDSSGGLPTYDGEECEAGIKIQGPATKSLKIVHRN